MTDHIDYDSSHIVRLSEAGAFRPLKGSAMLTYIALFARCGVDRPWACVRLEELAYLTGLARSSVASAIRQLIAMKLIEHRSGRGGAPSSFRVPRRLDLPLTTAA